MIAVTYLEGWMLAHPVPVFIFIACCAIAAVYVLYMHAENRRDDREGGLPQAPRRGTRSRARGTRARRHAFLGSACRRAGAIAAWVTSWFWWLDSWPAAREQLTAAWARARQQVTAHARGITIDVTNVPGRDGKRPDPPPTRREAPVSTMRPDTHLYGGPGHPAGDLQAPAAGVSPPVKGTGTRTAEAGPQGVPSPPPQETREPGRLATGAGRDALVLDYQPAEPFAGCLSAETIARGIPAVQ